jgi:tRNA (guanine37-N1)-methyltransferase
MEFHVITLFPEMFTALESGVIGRARARGLIKISTHDLRPHGRGKYRQIDDYPYGGGSGMIMRPEPLAEAIDHVMAQHPGLLKILLSPQGERLNQAMVRELSRCRPGLLLIAGRYEGIDARVSSMVDREVSIGDYILCGGELAAMVIIEATARLVPGVLGNPDSLAEESFGSSGLLEYPHFTRPEEFRGMRVPEVLLSGDHRRIRAWREAEARKRTARRHPDLLPTTDSCGPTTSRPRSPEAAGDSNQ